MSTTHQRALLGADIGPSYRIGLHRELSIGESLKDRLPIPVQILWDRQTSRLSIGPVTYSGAPKVVKSEKPIA